MTLTHFSPSNAVSLSSLCRFFLRLNLSSAWQSSPLPKPLNNTCCWVFLPTRFSFVWEQDFGPQSNVYYCVLEDGLLWFERSRVCRLCVECVRYWSLFHAWPKPKLSFDLQVLQVSSFVFGLFLIKRREFESNVIAIHWNQLIVSFKLIGCSGLSRQPIRVFEHSWLSWDSI